MIFDFLRLFVRYILGGFMNIGARLEAVGSLVLPNSILADIGTDHAYLPVYLSMNAMFFAKNIWEDKTLIIFIISLRLEVRHWTI